jgi:hypothetical protein
MKPRVFFGNFGARFQEHRNRLEGVNSVTSTVQIVSLIVGTLSTIRAIDLVAIKVCKDTKHTPIHIERYADLFQKYLH